MRAKRWGICLAVSLSLYAGAISAAAAPTGYASAFEGLYQVDLATGQASKVGNYGTNITDVEGLTYQPDGSLIGISDARKSLYRLVPGSGRAAFVATLAQELRDFEALDLGIAASCGGTLYVSSDEQRKLWRLGQDGSAVFIADLPAAISGLAFRDDMLYGVAVSNPNPAGEGLWRIDPETGAATLLGAFTTPRPVRDAGLDFSADGRLWATFDYNPPASGGQIADFSDIAELDPETGAILSRKQVTGVPAGSDFEGLAVAPPVCAPQGQPVATPRQVPAGSPLSLLALGLGFFALAWATLRRFAR